MAVTTQDAMPRSPFHPSTIIHYAPLCAALAGALMLAGCGSKPTKDTAVAEAPALTPQPSPATTTIDAASQRLASQAARDVDLLLARRTTESTPKPVAANPADTPPTGPQAIRWNPPPATTRQADPSSAPAPVPESPSAASAISDTLAAADQSTATPDLSPHQLKQLMIDLSAELYRQGADADNPLPQLVLIAAMGLVDAERALNTEALPDLTAEERDVLAALQSFFATLGQTLPTATDTTAATAEAVTALRDSLVKPPTLELPTTALCTSVEGFGSFTPIEPMVFLANEDQPVIVYAEVDDFTSTCSATGEWKTELSQHLTIYSDRDSIPVWKEDWQTVVDVSRQRRTDFFTVQVITLPRALSVGKYHLKIRMRDEQSGAEVEKSIPFEMVADPRMAARLP